MNAMEVPSSGLKVDTEDEAFEGEETESAIIDDESNCANIRSRPPISDELQQKDRIPDHLTPPRSPTLHGQKLVSQIHSTSHYAKIWGVALRALSKVGLFELSEDIEITES